MFSRKSNISIRDSCSDLIHRQGRMAQRQKPVIIHVEYAQNQEQTPDFQVSTELLHRPSPEKIHKSFDSSRAWKSAALTVNTHSRPCYVDPTWNPGPWCGEIAGLAGFGCSRAVSFMWSIPTGGSSPFKVQHLASAPADRNLEAGWKWMGGGMGCGAQKEN